MKKDLLKYISGAIIGAVICLLIFQECNPSKTVEVRTTDTLTIEKVVSDTIRLTVEKPVYVTRVRTLRDIDTLTDTVTRYIALDSLRTYKQKYEDSNLTISSTIQTRGFLEGHKLNYTLKEKKVPLPTLKPDNWDGYLGASGHERALYGVIGIRRKNMLLQAGYDPFNKAFIFGAHYKLF